jgi:hypothetical protein
MAEAEYYFGLGVGSDNSPALEAVKTWMEGDERRFDRLTVAEYGMYEEAAVDERELEQARQQRGLEAAMQLAENMAVAGGHLDPEREDPRLFTQGPLDPFETIREGEIDEKLARHGVTWREAHEWALESRERQAAAWRMETLPVHTPEGEALGYAVELVTGPGVGGDDPPLPDEPLWMMDVAHFEQAAQAEAFTDVFHDNVEPGVLDGPTLAAEIARQEGLLGEHRLLSGVEMENYINGDLSLICDPAEWHPHRPENTSQQIVELELEL